MGRTLAIAAAILVSTQSAEAQDRYTGVFETDGLVVYIVPTSDGEYRGRIDAGLETFTLEAESQWGLGLLGNYTRDGRETRFAATVVAGQLVLGDGISTYYLSRTDEVVPPEIAREVLGQEGASKGDVPYTPPEGGSEAAYPEEAAPSDPVGGPRSESAQLFEDVFQGYRFSAPVGWVGNRTAEGFAFQSSAGRQVRPSSNKGPKRHQAASRRLTLAAAAGPLESDRTPRHVADSLFRNALHGSAT